MYNSQYRHENSSGFYADHYTYLVMKLERWEVGIRRKAGPKWELVNHESMMMFDFGKDPKWHLFQLSDRPKTFTGAEGLWI